MIDNLPVQTAQIYDYLSKGNFLCSNTSVKELRTLFSVVEDNFERLRDYFSHINFVLEQGKITFTSPARSPGLPWSKSSSVSSLGSISWTSSVRTIRPSARFHLLAGGDIGTFPYRHGSRDEAGRVEKTYRRQGETQGYPRYHLGRMTKEGFIECVSDMNGTWKVLSSWDYLTKMIHSINIKNEDEISQ